MGRCMTEESAETRLARIEGSLLHITQMVDAAADDRKEVGRQLAAIAGRVAVLEAVRVSPSEVHATSIEAAVTKALREKSEENKDNARSNLALAVSIGAVLSTIAGTVLSQFITVNGGM